MPSTASPGRSVASVSSRGAAARTAGGIAFMMYGEADAAADLGTPSRWIAGPGAGLRVHRLERRRRCRLLGAVLRRRRARRLALRTDRPRGVLRLPDGAPEGQNRACRRARDHLADRRGLRRARAARAARPGAAGRARALDALALLHHADPRPRRGARRAARLLARRAPRRRPPQPADAGL